MPTDHDKALTLIRNRCELFLGSNAHATGFGAEQARLCRLGEIVVEGVELDGEDDTAPNRGAKAKVTVELTVDDSCCNLSGNAHGGFLAWLIDHCSSLALIALSGHGRWETSGVSSNINTYYIAAAPLGMPIQVVSTVLQQGKTSAVLEARVEERSTGKLLALGTHLKQDVQRRPAKL